MWKLIIILVLVVYLLNKLGSVIFRVMGRAQPPPNFRRPPNGGMHVNDTGKQTPRRNSGMKGGEYVDYEEVK